MFDSYNSSTIAQILHFKSKSNIELVQLQRSLDSLVYWESLYNRENGIDKNPEHLNILIAINEITGDRTPDAYFITNQKNTKLTSSIAKKVSQIKNNINPKVKKSISIVLPSNFDYTYLEDLCISKTEIFMLRDSTPGATQNTISKTEINGEYYFLKTSKHKNIETEKEITGSEYLMLTTNINVDIPRISTTRYSFTYNKQKYSIVINNSEHTAILEMYESEEIPDFLRPNINE